MILSSCCEASGGASGGASCFLRLVFLLADNDFREFTNIIFGTFAFETGPATVRTPYGLGVKEWEQGLQVYAKQAEKLAELQSK